MVQMAYHTPAFWTVRKKWAWTRSCTHHFCSYLTGQSHSHTWLQEMLKRSFLFQSAMCSFKNTFIRQEEDRYWEITSNLFPNFLSLFFCKHKQSNLDLPILGFEDRTCNRLLWLCQVSSINTYMVPEIVRNHPQTVEDPSLMKYISDCLL